jgi:RNA polymerase sigma factor (sigma-70 family)
MATAQMDTVIRHLRRAVLGQDGAACTDGQLLASFIDQKDEAAFELLVRRHGSMVFGVCRRIIDNHHDAEDAFQATFLVLARRASSVRPRERVANWLHGVALRTAMKARTMARKRRGREKQVTEMPEPEAPQQRQCCDLQPLLDQELNGLPENYRLAILLCDLEGKAIKEAAQQLGWPQGSLAGRLARGRKLLAMRLASRGVVLSAGSLALVVSQNVASAGVPISLMSSTVEAACIIAAGQATVAGVVPSKVAVLTEELVTTMLLTKLKAWSLPLVALGLLGVVGSGAAVLVGQTTSTQTKGDQPPRPEASRPSALPEKGVERPAGDAAVGYVRVDRNPKAPATPYRALFTKALDVVSGHFEQITSADAFTGRIEALQPVGKRKVILEIRTTDEGVFAIWVRVLNEAGKDRTGSELDLERRILRQLDAQSGDLLPVPPATGGSQARQTDEQPKNKAAPNLPTASQRGNKLDDDLAKLQGTWLLVLHHWKGRDVDPGPATLSFKSDACTVIRKNGKATWRIKLGAAKKPEQPKQIDFLAGDAKTPGIYKLEGTTLLICQGPDGKDRPSEFAAGAESDDELFVFRRLTPADGVDERPVKVGSIVILGNTKTEDGAIRKILRLRPGDAIDYQALRTAKKNLEALKATIDLVESVDNADYKDIRVTVVEK